jgi:hypothetical protein
MNLATATGDHMGKRKKDVEEVKPKKKKRRLRKLFFLAIVGGGVALARSESLRSTVLDKLFGAEKEFNYSESAGADAGTTPDA